LLVSWRWVSSYDCLPDIHLTFTSSESSVWVIFGLGLASRTKCNPIRVPRARFHIQHSCRRISSGCRCRPSRLSLYCMSHQTRSYALSGIFNLIFWVSFYASLAFIDSAFHTYPVSSSYLSRSVSLVVFSAIFSIILLVPIMS